MRTVVRAIITNNDSLLVIKRVKDGASYWVFPGGGVEDDEDHVFALVRECKEELGLDIEVLDLMSDYYYIQSGNKKQKEYFYKCDISGGKLGTGNGPEYSPQNNKGIYEPMWINMDKLANLDVRPIEIRNKLILVNNMEE